MHDQCDPRYATAKRDSFRLLHFFLMLRLFCSCSGNVFCVCRPFAVPQRLFQFVICARFARWFAQHAPFLSNVGVALVAGIWHSPDCLLLPPLPSLLACLHCHLCAPHTDSGCMSMHVNVFMLETQDCSVADRGREVARLGALLGLLERWERWILGRPHWVLSLCVCTSVRCGWKVNMVQRWRGATPDARWKINSMQSPHHAACPPCLHVPPAACTPLFPSPSPCLLIAFIISSSALLWYSLPFKMIYSALCRAVPRQLVVRERRAAHPLLICLV